MIRTGFLFGIANAGVALALLMILPRRAELRLEKVTAMLILAVLIAGFAVSDRMQRWAETAGYEEPVVYAESTPFQRIVLRSEEHTSELQSLMRNSYAVFCLKKTINLTYNTT